MISLLLISILALADAEMPIDGFSNCKLGKAEFDVVLASEPGKEKKSDDAGSADLFIQHDKIVFIEKASPDAAYEFSEKKAGSVCDKMMGYKLGKDSVGLLYMKVNKPNPNTFSLAVYNVKTRKIVARESDLVQFPTLVTWDGKKLSVEPAKPAETSTTTTTLPSP